MLENLIHAYSKAACMLDVAGCNLSCHRFGTAVSFCMSHHTQRDHELGPRLHESMESKARHAAPAQGRSGRVGHQAEGAAPQNSRPHLPSVLADLGASTEPGTPQWGITNRVDTTVSVVHILASLVPRQDRTLAAFCRGLLLKAGPLTCSPVAQQQCGGRSDS